MGDLRKGSPSLVVSEEEDRKTPSRLFRSLSDRRKKKLASGQEFQTPVNAGGSGGMGRESPATESGGETNRPSLGSLEVSQGYATDGEGNPRLKTWGSFKSALRRSFRKSQKELRDKDDVGGGGGGGAISNGGMSLSASSTPSATPTPHSFGQRKKSESSLDWPDMGDGNGGSNGNGATGSKHKSGLKGFIMGTLGRGKKKKDRAHSSNSESPSPAPSPKVDHAAPPAKADFFKSRKGSHLWAARYGPDEVTLATIGIEDMLPSELEAMRAYAQEHVTIMLGKPGILADLNRSDKADKIRRASLPNFLRVFSGGGGSGGSGGGGVGGRKSQGFESPSIESQYQQLQQQLQLQQHGPGTPQNLTLPAMSAAQRRVQSLGDTPRIFGRPLDQLVEEERIRFNEPHLKIPRVASLTISYIETHGLQSEGIFRVSGSAKRIRGITEAFDMNQPVDFSQASPNDVASVFKYFLRALPVPLLTYPLYHAFVSVINLPTADEQLLALRLLCCLLPAAHRDLLQATLALLSKVAAVAADGQGSRMNSRNLAVVFAPNMLKEEETRKGKKKGADERSLEDRQLGVDAADSDMLAQEGDACDVVELMIDYNEHLFVVPADLRDNMLLHHQTTNPAVITAVLRDIVAAAKSALPGTPPSALTHGAAVPTPTPTPSHPRMATLVATPYTTGSRAPSIGEASVAGVDTVPPRSHRDSLLATPSLPQPRHSLSMPPTMHQQLLSAGFIPAPTPTGSNAHGHHHGHHHGHEEDASRSWKSAAGAAMASGGYESTDSEDLRGEDADAGRMGSASPTYDNEDQLEGDEGDDIIGSNAEEEEEEEEEVEEGEEGKGEGGGDPWENPVLDSSLLADLAKAWDRALVTSSDAMAAVRRTPADDPDAEGRLPDGRVSSPYSAEDEPAPIRIVQRSNNGRQPHSGLYHDTQRTHLAHAKAGTAASSAQYTRQVLPETTRVAKQSAAFNARFAQAQTPSRSVQQAVQPMRYASPVLYMDDPTDDDGTIV